MNLNVWGKLKEEVKSDFDLWVEGKCKDGGKEKYCRLCEKREKRGTCGYGGTMWDKYTVNDVSDSERAAAVEESGITSNGSEGGGEGALHEDEYRRMLAKERQTEKQKELKRGGPKSVTPGKNTKNSAKDYADQQKQSIDYHDKKSKNNKIVVGMVKEWKLITKFKRED